MILYIQTAFLGDLLLSVPTLKRLKKLYPNQEIHLLCRKGLGDFFIRESLVDRVVDSFRGSKPTIKEVKKLFLNQHYEILICPHQSLRSTLISHFISAQRKIGYDSFINRIVFDELILRPMKWPESLRQLALLTKLDLELAKHLVDVGNRTAPFSEIPLWSSMKVNHFLERYHYRENFLKKYELDENKKIFLLAPGSVWATKRWGASRFVELAQLLLDRGHHVVLIGSPGERDLAEFIYQQESRVINIVGQTQIPEMVEIIAGADAIVTNDSGAMHMASITETPTVAIFGPTVQSFGYQPWNSRARVIENISLKCRPCSSHGGRKCPIGTHECMTSISPQVVLNALEGLLQNDVPLS